MSNKRLHSCEIVIRVEMVEVVQGKVRMVIIHRYPVLENNLQDDI